MVADRPATGSTTCKQTWLWGRRAGVARSSGATLMPLPTVLSLTLGKGPASVPAQCPTLVPHKLFLSGLGSWVLLSAMLGA